MNFNVVMIRLFSVIMAMLGVVMFFAVALNDAATVYFMLSMMFMSKLFIEIFKVDLE